MNLPDKCPFCGSEPYTTASGEQCRGGDRWVLFSCDTSIYAGQDLRRTQSRKCEDAERARLAARVAELEARCKRLDELGSKLEEEKEAHAWEISPAMAQAKIDELNAKVATLEANGLELGRNVAQGALKAAFARVAELEARCKRLEEAGDALERDKQTFKKMLADLGVVGSMGFGSAVKWAQAKEAKP